MMQQWQHTQQHKATAAEKEEEEDVGVGVGERDVGGGGSTGSKACLRNNINRHIYKPHSVTSLTNQTRPTTQPKPTCSDVTILSVAATLSAAGSVELPAAAAAASSPLDEASWVNRLCYCYV